VYGDPVGTYDPKTGTVKKGVILVAYMAEQLNRLTKQDREKILKHTDWNGQEEAFKSYHDGALASYEANGVKFTPSMTKEEVDEVFAKWMFWWDDVQEPEEAPGLIHIPGPDEVAEFMAKGLGWHDAGKAMLEFGWADHPEFATDSVKGILNNRKAVSFSDTLTDEEEFTSELSEDTTVVDEEPASEEETSEAWPDDEVPFDVASEVEEEATASTDEDDDDDDEFPEVDLEEDDEEEDDVFEEDEEDEEEDAPDPDDVASEKEEEMRNSMEAAKGRSKRRVSKRNSPPVE